MVCGVYNYMQWDLLGNWKWKAEKRNGNGKVGNGRRNNAVRTVHLLCGFSSSCIRNTCYIDAVHSYCCMCMPSSVVSSLTLSWRLTLHVTGYYYNTLQYTSNK